MYEVPTINLSAHQLTETEKSQLKLGFEYSFIDKNKNQRKFLVANLESVFQRVDDEINQEVKEYTIFFIKNVNNAKGYTYFIWCNQ